MNRPYLKYVLETHGISREDLMREQDWSPTTYSRKVVNGESDWLVREVRILQELGVSGQELTKIFFSE